ncbi:hypothetical protein V6N13_001895 [Hibiscus sabdariffa]
MPEGRWMSWRRALVGRGLQGWSGISASVEVGDGPLDPIKDVPRENPRDALAAVDVLDAVSENIPPSDLLV